MNQTEVNRKALTFTRLLLAKVSSDLTVNVCRVKRSFIDIRSNILPHVATLGHIDPNRDDGR